MTNYLKFKNLKFAYKMAFGFGVIMLSLIIYAGYNLYSLYRINLNSEVIDAYTQQALQLKDRHIDHLEWVNGLGHIIISERDGVGALERDPSKCRFGQMYYSDQRMVLEEMIPELKPILSSMELPHARIHAAADSVAYLIQVNANREALSDVYVQEAEANMEILGGLLHEAEVLIDQQIGVLQEDSYALKERIVLVISILGLLLLAFSVVISVMLTRNIRRALNEFIRVAEQIAAGDLTEDVVFEQDDELGQLAAALRKMKSRLEDIIGFLKSESVNFENVSKELSAASVSLSEGASEQASSLEEISTTMEEMNASIEQNSDLAQKTGGVSRVAAVGIHEVEQKSLSAYAANEVIAQRIAVISDIVFQTNILALNASVEAARAGEHGKGFAVVAGEVRKLADRSKEAADEILKVVKEGLELTRQSKVKLQELMPEVQKTSDYLAEIAAAGQEQTNGSVQINTALQELNMVTQHSAGSSEELAAAAQNLESRARQLRDTAGFFKTNELEVYSVVEEEAALSCPVNGVDRSEVF